MSVSCLVVGSSLLAAGCRVATVGQLLFTPCAWAYSTLHPLGVEPCAAPVAPPPPKFLATAGANRRRGWKCDRRRKTVNDIFVDYVVNTLSFLDRLGVGCRVTVPPVTYLITQAGSMTPPNYLWLLLAQRCLSTCLRLHSWPWPDA